MESPKSKTSLGIKFGLAAALLLASYSILSQWPANELISTRPAVPVFQTDQPEQISQEQGERAHAGIQKSDPAPVGANAIQSKEGIDAIRAVLEMDRKALRSAREERDYREALQNPELIDSATAVISFVGRFGSNEALLQNEKQRMDAVLFLSRSIEWKNNPFSSEVKAVITKIVLDDAGSRTEDIRLKKSLAADRIELFANLKEIDKEAGREIESRAVVNPATQKLLKFANNFYQLNESKKR